MPINSALKRLRQEDYKFKASLACIVRPYLKTNSDDDKYKNKSGKECL
jgi:hypothetical protein